MKTFTTLALTLALAPLAQRLLVSLIREHAGVFAFALVGVALAGPGLLALAVLHRFARDPRPSND